MNRAEFDNGLPHSSVLKEDSLEVLRNRYGNFAGSVLIEVKRIDPDAPDDILTFGDNWCQLVQMENDPSDDIERIPQQLNVVCSALRKPIRARQSDSDIHSLMKDLQELVNARLLDDRIMNKLAVLDLTTVNPPLQEQDLTQRTDTPWGVSGILIGTDTMIYHLTSGFYRKTVEDIHGKPGDSLSTSIFRQGPMIELKK